MIMLLGSVLGQMHRTLPSRVLNPPHETVSGYSARPNVVLTGNTGPTVNFKSLCVKLKVFVFSAVIALSLLNNAYAISGKDCQTSSGDDRYSLSYNLHVYGKITKNTPPGTVFGQISAIGTAFTCPLRSWRWDLQLAPRSISVDGRQDVCKTNINGIGIQYLNVDGNGIRCDHWNDILEVPNNTKSGFLNNGKVLARLMRISGPLTAGAHQLNLTARLTAYYPGHTDSVPWGVFLNRGSDVIQVSTGNPLIFFPEFPLASPNVDLGLKGGPSGSMSGIRQVDMCLYDGNDSTSKLISLTLRDEGVSAAGRLPGMFSVYRQGSDKSKVADRLDYELSVLNPTTGATEAVTEGKEFYWGGTNNRGIQRRVALPGVPGLTYCVPAPLTLKTPAFKANGKNAGHYMGVLKVIYRIPTIG